MLAKIKISVAYTPNCKSIYTELPVGGRTHHLRLCKISFPLGTACHADESFNPGIAFNVEDMARQIFILGLWDKSPPRHSNGRLPPF